jgi:tRNA splicing endonuclease
VTIALAGDRYFMWDALEVARLRTRGHLAITAIGSCAVKTSTRGKAAALPVMLSDEEVCVLLEAGWARVVDAMGAPVDNASAQLAAEVAGDPTGVRSVRRLAFRDLWLRGYCLTNGVKFGCDYLCYRDDPTAVHAAFMVVVLREGCGVRTLSLTAVARVATTALKIAVVAWVDPHARTVRYAAFKRMGPGSAIFSDARAAEGGAVSAAGAGGAEGVQEAPSGAVNA